MRAIELTDAELANYVAPGADADARDAAVSVVDAHGWRPLVNKVANLEIAIAFYGAVRGERPDYAMISGDEARRERNNKQENNLND